MQLRDLTTECQTHSHNGEALCEVMIKIQDGYYKIKNVKRAQSGEHTVFLIEADYGR